MGLIPPGLRLPLTPLSQRYHDVVRRAMKQAGVLYLATLDCQVTMSSSRCLALVGIAGLLAACSTAKHDEYKNAKALPPLDVLPDLINPPKDTATAVPAACSASAAVSPP